MVRNVAGTYTSLGQHRDRERRRREEDERRQTEEEWIRRREEDRIRREEGEEEEKRICTESAGPRGRQTRDARSVGPAFSLYTRYKAFLQLLREYSTQLKLAEIQRQIATASDMLDTALVSALIMEQKTLLARSAYDTIAATLPFATVLSRLTSLCAEVKDHYSSLITSGDFDEGYAALCERTYRPLLRLLAGLQSVQSSSGNCDWDKEGNRGLVIRHIERCLESQRLSEIVRYHLNGYEQIETERETKNKRVYLNTREEAFHLLQQKPTDASATAASVTEESAASLGLSTELAAQYTALLEDMQVYVDQPTVREIDDRIAVSR